MEILLQLYFQGLSDPQSLRDMLQTAIEPESPLDPLILMEYAMVIALSSQIALNHTEHPYSVF